MPCRCDYMDPNQYELQSIRTANLLKYTLEHLKKAVPDYVEAATISTYGNAQKLNDMVVMLCAELSALDSKKLDKLVYNSKDKTARALADWWGEHQEADKKRIEKEKKEAATQKLKKQAFAKLSAEEKKALGLK